MLCKRNLYMNKHFFVAIHLDPVHDGGLNRSPHGNAAQEAVGFNKN